jgi:hypothetical protein
MNINSRVGLTLGWFRWRMPHLLRSIRAGWWNRIRLAGLEFRHRRVTVLTASGDIGGRLLSFRYGGFEDGLRYIQPYVEDRLFEGTRVSTRLEQLTRRELRRREAQEPVDMSIVAGNRSFVRGLPSRQAVIMPFRIHQVVDTSVGWDAVCAKISRREVKRHENWCEEYGYRCSPSTEDSDYFWFYDRMVVPSMEVRYGKRGRNLKREQGYYMIFRHGVLFLVDSHDGRVAGSTSELDRRRKLINARLIGIRDGDQNLRKYGAQNALYHFILEWACTHGFRSVDYQGCEPFLLKGTFQYKKRFATAVRLPPNHYRCVQMRLRAGSDCAQVRDFLANNPVMLVDAAGRLGGGYFYDRQRKPRTDIPYECEGFEFEERIDMDRFFASDREPTESQLEADEPEGVIR